MRITQRYQNRQNHTLRRAITSSCWRAASAPNRLGQGMNQRNTMSTNPRKAITSANVSSSAHGTESPVWTCSHTNAAGLVRRATIVAARVSLRQSPASPAALALPGANSLTGSSLAMGQVYLRVSGIREPPGVRARLILVDREGVRDEGDATDGLDRGGGDRPLGAGRRGRRLRGIGLAQRRRLEQRGRGRDRARERQGSGRGTATERAQGPLGHGGRPARSGAEAEPAADPLGRDQDRVAR